MTPFYTGDGDKGMTETLGPVSVNKDSLVIEAIGSIDAASAALGFARSLIEIENIKAIILRIQKELYALMADISELHSSSKNNIRITELDLSWVEDQIEELENAVKLPKGFILPGESPASAALAVARTVIRRAERRTITYFRSRGVQKSNTIAYLNRLSSLVFILEIYETSFSGHGVRMSRED